MSIPFLSCDGTLLNDYIQGNNNIQHFQWRPLYFYICTHVNDMLYVHSQTMVVLQQFFQFHDTSHNKQHHNHYSLRMLFLRYGNNLYTDPSLKLPPNLFHYNLSNVISHSRYNYYIYTVYIVNIRWQTKAIKLKQIESFS